MRICQEGELSNKRDKRNIQARETYHISPPIKPESARQSCCTFKQQNFALQAKLAKEMIMFAGIYKISELTFDAKAMK